MSRLTFVPQTLFFSLTVLIALPGKGEEEPTYEGKTVSEWAKEVQRAHFSIDRRDAAIALGKMGSKAKGAVETLAASYKEESNPTIRLAIVEALQAIDPESKPAMACFAAAVLDPLDDVREVAFKNLAKSGGSEAIAAFSKALQHEKARVRLTAAEGLAQLRKPKGKIDLTPFAAAWEVEENPSIRKKILEALVAIDGNAEATKEVVVIAFLETGESASDWIKERVKEIDSPTLVKHLCHALKSRKENVRKVAAEKLAQLGSKAKEAIPSLRSFLKTVNGEDGAFVQCALALAQIDPVSGAAEAFAALCKALDHYENHVRLTAAEALPQLRIPKEGIDVAPLAAAWETEQIPAIRAKILEALMAIDPKAKATKEVAVKAFLDAGESPSDLVKTHFNDIDSPSLVQCLCQGCESRKENVRIAAAETLARLGPKAKEAIPFLKGLLQKTKDWERADIQFALAQIDPVAFPLPVVDVGEHPLVEKYLHSGELAKGKQALLAALTATPTDDRLRFGLGVLQFVHGVERLGQSLHRYGATSEHTDIPILRVPVPKNADPATIDYAAFRKILDDFGRDLSTAEATLAGVSDRRVKLPLRLAAVRLDLVGDGKPVDKFIIILKRVMHRDRIDLPDSNTEFLVCFDRGDVAWLRAYCHLLMGMIDFYLAFDTEQVFDLSADQLFAKPKNRFSGTQDERRRKIQDAWKDIVVKEPARLGQFRNHLIKVAGLNRETWKYIRAETDDDHEWLPNPKQKGVLGLPVRDEMIDSWLAMMGELEGLLDGKRILPTAFVFQSRNKNGQGLNLKLLLDDPPKKFVMEGFPSNLSNKYWSDGQEIDLQVLFRVFQVFGDPMAVTYAVWFN